MLDDILPFIVFVVIALINLVTVSIDRKKKKSQRNSIPNTDSAQEDQNEVFLPPSDDFIDDYELSDENEQEVYNIPEMESVESSAYALQQNAELNDEKITSELNYNEAQIGSIQSALKAMPSTPLSLDALRFKTIPIQSSATRNSLSFSLKNKKNLKNAIIANIIFQSPRAYDRSFENSCL